MIEPCSQAVKAAPKDVPAAVVYSTACIGVVVAARVGPQSEEVETMLLLYAVSAAVAGALAAVGLAALASSRTGVAVSSAAFLTLPRAWGRTKALVGVCLTVACAELAKALWIVVSCHVASGTAHRLSGLDVTRLLSLLPTSLMLSRHEVILCASVEDAMSRS